MLPVIEIETWKNQAGVEVRGPRGPALRARAELLGLQLVATEQHDATIEGVEVWCVWRTMTGVTWEVREQGARGAFLLWLASREEAVLAARCYAKGYREGLRAGLDAGKSIGRLQERSALEGGGE